MPRTIAITRTVGLVAVAAGVVYLCAKGAVSGDQALEVLSTVAALVAGGAGVGALWAARRERLQQSDARRGGLASLPPPAPTLPPPIWDDTTPSTPVSTPIPDLDRSTETTKPDPWVQRGRPFRP